MLGSQFRSRPPERPHAASRFAAPVRSISRAWCPSAPASLLRRWCSIRRRCGSRASSTQPGQMSSVLAQFVSVATGRDPRRAARIAGAVSLMSESAHTMPIPITEGLFNHGVQIAKQKLGESAFTAAAACIEDRPRPNLAVAPIPQTIAAPLPGGLRSQNRARAMARRSPTSGRLTSIVERSAARRLSCSISSRSSWHRFCGHRPASCATLGC